MALNAAQADELRRLAAEVNDAVEARIRGEAGAVEKIRRTTQSVQLAGMGAFEYWGNQLWQPLKSICLVMAQEIGVLPKLNAHAGPVDAASIAKSVSSDELLICKTVVFALVHLLTEAKNWCSPSDASAYFCWRRP